MCPSGSAKPSVGHVHCVVVAEGVRGYLDRERHAVGASTASLNQVRTVRSEIAQLRAFSVRPACVFFTALKWNFQGSHHYLQLADVMS